MNSLETLKQTFQKIKEQAEEWEYVTVQSACDAAIQMIEEEQKKAECNENNS